MPNTKRETRDAEYERASNMKTNHTTLLDELTTANKQMKRYTKISRRLTSSKLDRLEQMGSSVADLFAAYDQRAEGARQSLSTSAPSAHSSRRLVLSTMRVA